MSDCKHALVGIPTENLETLRDSFSGVNWPEHVMAHNLITSLIDRFKKHPEHREFLKVYSVDGGDTGDDSTFIAVLNDKDIMMGTLDPELTRLKIGLRLINFERMKLFMGIRSIYRDIAMECVGAMNLKVLFDDGTTMVHMSREDALKLEIDAPEGTEIKGLSPSDAEKVNSVWPHASPGSVEFIRYVITFNQSVGLYEKSSGELLAWCLEHDYHCLLALQVDVNHLRKGYGSLVAKAITKKIAETCGVDIITNIIHKNHKSRRLFQKIGYKDIDSNYWIGLIEQ